MHLYQFLNGLVEVTLPECLEIKTTEKEGLVDFDCTQPIGLPYLEQDSGNEKWRRDQEIGHLANAVLRAALPQFVGDKDDGFYGHSCNRPTGNPNYGNRGHVPLQQYLNNQQPHGYIIGFDHDTEDGASAHLHVDAYTSGGWSEGSSGLRGGCLFGRVFPKVKIHSPREGRIYTVDITANILGGLLDRRGARGMLYAKGSKDDCPAVFIKDPTLERMKTALEHVKDIEQFFQDNSQKLQDVAILYSAEKKVLARMAMVMLSREFPRDLAEMEERVPDLKPWH